MTFTTFTWSRSYGRRGYEVFCTVHGGQPAASLGSRAYLEARLGYHLTRTTYYSLTSAAADGTIRRMLASAESH